LEVARKALWGWEATVSNKRSGLEVGVKALGGVGGIKYESDMGGLEEAFKVLWGVKGNNCKH